MSKFSRHEWQFTGANENLFDLSPGQRRRFRLLVKEASKR